MLDIERTIVLPINHPLFFIDCSMPARFSFDSVRKGQQALCGIDWLYKQNRFSDRQAYLPC